MLGLEIHICLHGQGRPREDFEFNSVRIFVSEQCSWVQAVATCLEKLRSKTEHCPAFKDLGVSTADYKSIF